MTEGRADGDFIRQAVLAAYGAVASKGGSCCGASPRGGAAELVGRIGYSIADLSALPEGANLGLSCGNPTAIASLEPGEVVLDLGAGGGFDVFIAGPKVGPAGRAIGVDIRLTPRPAYIEAMVAADDPLYAKIVGRLPAGMGPADYVTSLEVSARKPREQKP